MSAIIIPARYNSTRLPGKPLLKIGDVPMIVKVAVNCMKSVADRVIVATDDLRILEVCEKVENLEVTMTEKEYNSGTDRVADVAKFLRDEVIINVQGDEPFLPVSLINDLIEDLENGPAYMNSAYVEVDPSESADPNCVKVVIDKNGYALYFSRSQVPYIREHVAHKFKKHIGVYGFKRDFLLEYSRMPSTPLEKAEGLEQLRALENGYKIKMIKSCKDSLSIDTNSDLRKANSLDFYGNLS
jgi:3-deoxy-manno-octulosonate cytidylyltransferase (CMP-KDO synthetase)